MCLGRSIPGNMIFRAYKTSVADIAKEQLAASRMAAAWRLGQWEVLEGLPSPAPHQLDLLDSDERWEVRLGKMLAAVHTRYVSSPPCFAYFALPCLALPYPGLPCLLLFYSALPFSCHTLSSPALLCPSPPCLSRLTLPCIALPCLASLCPSLPYSALPCLVLLPYNNICLVSPPCHAFTSCLQQLMPSTAAHSLTHSQLVICRHSLRSLLE